MADHECHYPEGQAQKREESKKQHAEDDFRRHHRESGNVFHYPFAAKARAHRADRAERADDCCRKRGEHTEKQAVDQRRSNVTITKKILIPFEGEARPDGTEFVFVEGIDHNDDNRQVHQNREQDQIGFREYRAFFHTIPSISLLR